MSTWHGDYLLHDEVVVGKVERSDKDIGNYASCDGYVADREWRKVVTRATRGYAQQIVETRVEQLLAERRSASTQPSASIATDSVLRAAVLYRAAYASLHAAEDAETDAVKAAAEAEYAVVEARRARDDALAALVEAAKQAAQT